MLLDWLDARSKRIYQQAVNEASMLSLAINDPKGFVDVVKQPVPQETDFTPWWGQEQESGD